jgi:hypothetical protein
MMSQSTPPSTQRDLRLDFFRGLALWLIFVDHIPTNIVNSFTIRNFGFSDAAEIFVFISGYTAALVYGRAMHERGVLVGSARILRRVWQLYVAHVFLFIIFMAEIFFVANRFENPLFTEEMQLMEFIRQPDETLLHGLMLTFKPVNMDILPVYIVLLLTFPPVLWLLLRAPNIMLMASLGIYIVAHEFGWNFPSFPSGYWVINPFHWQLLFVLGAWCAVFGAQRLQNVIRSPIVVTIAVIYLIFALVVVTSWYVPRLASHMPRWLDIIYPIDKTNLDVLRFAHFLALATVVVRFIPQDWSALGSRWLRPALLCGQHSLEIFCLGIFLSFTAHFVIVQVSSSVTMQILISIAGIIIMSATAMLITWYQGIEKQGSGSRQPLPNADIAGGDV